MRNKFKFIMLVLSLVFLASCGNSKSNESVFSNTAESAACKSSAVSNRYIVQWENGAYTLEKTEPGTSDDDFRNSFVQKHLAFIKHVDRDHQIQLKQDDMKTSSVQSMDATTTANLSWGPYKIQADSVWSQGFKGQGVLVGVVDGMVDQTQQQLANNIAWDKQFNSETNDPNTNQHGTHVAGIIAADPAYGPVTGVAPSAKIIAGQFIGNTGGGSLGDAIVAMNAVAAQGAKVINMSWGGAGCVDSLKSAVQSLSDQGIIVVTAAGNDGVNSDEQPDYPAAFGFANQINVAATASSDQIIYFSNYGFNTVNLGAPGVGIYSTIPGNKVESMDGTSMAAPMVTGTIALLLSAFPSASSQQIKQAIYSSVDVYSDYQVSTRGRINVKKALDALRSMLSSQ